MGHYGDRADTNSTEDTGPGYQSDTVQHTECVATHPAHVHSACPRAAHDYESHAVQKHAHTHTHTTHTHTHKHTQVHRRLWMIPGPCSWQLWTRPKLHNIGPLQQRKLARPDPKVNQTRTQMIKCCPGSSHASRLPACWHVADEYLLQMQTTLAICAGSLDKVGVVRAGLRAQALAILHGRAAARARRAVRVGGTSSLGTW